MSTLTFFLYSSAHLKEALLIIDLDGKKIKTMLQLDVNFLSSNADTCIPMPHTLASPYASSSSFSLFTTNSWSICTVRCTIFSLYCSINHLFQMSTSILKTCPLLERHSLCA